MFKFFTLPHLLQIKYYKADSGGEMLWYIIIGIVIIAIIRGNKKNKEIQRNNEIIINCQYCKRRVKRGNLVRGQCPFCGNQVE